MLRILICVLLLAIGSVHAQAKDRTHAQAKPRGAMQLRLPGTEPPVEIYAKSHALVIGIDRYTHGWPRLDKAVADANAVGDELERRGFTVTRAHNLDTAELASTIRNFMIDSGDDPQARLFIWFAGHGHTMHGQGYLVPADAPDPKKEPQAFRRQAVNMGRLEVAMKEPRAKHVMMVLDACFSGQVITAYKGAFDPHIARKARLPVRQFITSGSGDQVVPDDGRFRELFLRSIKGDEPRADQNKDGYVTGRELGAFLQAEVTNMTREAQIPRIGTLRDPRFDDGDFVFEVREIKEPDRRPAPKAPVGKALEVWNAIKDMDSPGVFEVYIAKFPDSVYATLAKARLAELRRRREPEVAVGEFPDGPQPGAAPDHKAGKEFQDCAWCPKMVVVPKGSFMMGSPASETGRGDEEGPQRLVTISKPFAVGKYEVTVGAYLKCVRAGGCDEPEWREPGSKYNTETGSDFHYAKLSAALTDPRHPIVGVSWKDAKAYVNWLSGETGKTYRLLSEAEWEYAARAGTREAYWWGPSASHEYANYGKRVCCGGLASGRDRWMGTSPVGAFKANAFGLHDMHGNVWEWVEDCWNVNYAGVQSDGSPLTSGYCTRRVLRGGSWDLNPRYLRSAIRDRYSTTYRGNDLGFRVARPL